MLFHVTARVLDTVALDADQRLRAALGPQFQRIHESGKVRSSGVFAGMRAAYFVVEVERAEELYELFGPELFAGCHTEVHAVATMEKIGELFQQWAAQGR